MSINGSGSRFFCLYLLLGILSFAGIAYAQSYTVSFFGKNDLRKANHFYKKKNYEEAVKLYSAFLSHKKSPVKVQLALANSLKQLYRTSESENWYRKASANNTLPDYCQLDFAEVLIMNGKVSEANEYVKNYLVQHPEDAKATLMLKETSQYPSFYKDSLQYSIQAYSGNSVYSDYAPVYYKNDIVFCSSRPTDGIIKHVESANNQPLSHLFESSVNGDHINTFNGLHHNSKHDGPITFWDNYTKAIYCSNSDELFEHGKLALFFSAYSSDKKEWNKPVVLPFVNHQYSFGHPTFNALQQALYFVSDMPGGYGGTDIYRSYWKNDQWTIPENLGAFINTSGNEMYPFFTKDDVLYFASNGHAGMGGLDLYASKTDSNETYLYNLGYPVNSAFDDFSMALSDSSSTGLFSSNRTGNDDIFTVKIYKIAWQLEVTDQLNYKPLAKCIVKILDQETGEVKHVLNTNKNGLVNCALIPGKTYAIKIYKNGYAMKSTEFAEPDREKKNARQRVTIARIHQRYVKAKIMHAADLIGNCEVKLVDYSSDTIMSYKTDSSGSFLCQINSDTTALLYLTKGGWHGYALFEKDVDSRENSGITYVNVQLQDSMATHLVKGSFQNMDGSYVPNATLYCQNRINQQVYTIQTDGEGAFTTALESFGIYDVYATADLSKPLSTVDASSVNFIGVTLPN